MVEQWESDPTILASIYLKQQQNQILLERYKVYDTCHELVRVVVQKIKAGKEIVEFFRVNIRCKRFPRDDKNSEIWKKKADHCKRILPFKPKSL